MKALIPIKFVKSICFMFKKNKEHNFEMTDILNLEEKQYIIPENLGDEIAIGFIDNPNMFRMKDIFDFLKVELQRTDGDIIFQETGVKKIIKNVPVSKEINFLLSIIKEHSINVKST